MENLLFLGVPILKHIRVSYGSVSSPINQAVVSLLVKIIEATFLES